MSGALLIATHVLLFVLGLGLGVCFRERVAQEPSRTHLWTRWHLSPGSRRAVADVYGSWREQFSAPTGLQPDEEAPC